MSSYIVRSYYHSCKKGTEEEILKKAPFASLKKKDKNGKVVIPFLGEGFYFYEENLEAAIEWGENHYKEYSTIEIENAKVKEEVLLDLNDSKSIKEFNRLRDLYLQKFPNRKSWELNKWIEFFKTIAIHQKNTLLFPYNYVRAFQIHKKKYEIRKFGTKEIFSKIAPQYYTFTNPLRILCIIDFNKIECKNRSVIASN